MAALIVLAVLVFSSWSSAARTIRVIPQARAGVVERLGRYSRTLEPGLTIVTPFIDRVKPLVDLREQVVNFSPQSVITEDNVVVGIETVLYFTITDPRSATYEIANPLQAIEQLTVTTLRNVIGGLTLEATLTARENVNTELRVVLDEATGKWGIRINRVEIKSVDPPADIRTAMEKQMRAERDRRAAILTAEGEKQAQILTAEGEKQAAVLTAEGARQAAILRAEGEAKAIDTVFKAIHEGGPDPRAAQLRIPADAPPAGRRRRQQGVRHPLRVRRGVRRHRRGARRASASARTDPPTRRHARARHAASRRGVVGVAGGLARARARARAPCGWLRESAAMFDSLAEKLQATLSDVRERGTLTEQDIDRAMREIRLALLEADVNFKVVKEFTATSRSAAWARRSSAS